MKSFTIERQPDGSWSTKVTHPGACSTMQYHVNSLELELQERYDRENTVVGAIRPDEEIQQLTISADGVITFKFQTMENTKTHDSN